MKKTLLVFVMMIALVGFTFALDATVQGSAISTFGYNLETGDSGFSNSLDKFGIYFWLLDEGSAFDNNGDGNYGSIEISDLSVALVSDGSTAAADNDTDSVTGTVSAKIHFGDMFVGVYNKPDVDVNYAANFSAKSQGGVDINNDIVNLGPTGGMSVGYDDGTNSVEFGVSSVGDWKDSTKASVTAVSTWNTLISKVTADTNTVAENTSNKYVASLSSSFDFGAPALDVAFLYGNKQWGSDAYMGFSVKPSVEAGALEASVGADVVSIPNDAVVGMADTKGLFYDVAPEVTYNLTDENADGDMSNVMVGAYIQSSTGKFYTDNFNMLMNVQGVLTEQHKGGFVDGMGATAAFKLLNVLDYDKDLAADGMTYAVDVTLDYDIQAGLTPSVAFGMGTDDNKTNLAVGLEMGSDFTGIANTTFNFDYATSSLSDADATDDAAAAVADKGIFTVKTTIAW